jgi:hypothetical protein
MKVVIGLLIASYFTLDQIPQKCKGDQKQVCVSYYDSLLSRRIYDKLDTSAVYVGGEPQLLKYILNNLKLSQHELDAGKIHMYFIVNENGKVEEVGFEKDIYESLKAKLRKLFEGNSNWTPGKCKNEKVISKTRFTFRW